jgi:hypothetical protein
VIAVNDTTKTITVNANWTKSVVSSRGYYTTRNNGTATASTLTDTVAFSTSIMTNQVNIGDILICEGQMTKIIEQLSASSAKVSPSVNLGSTKPCSIWTTGALHEGAHVVTAISGNVVTVTNRSQPKPPHKRITGGRAIAPKTVLKNTGTGDGIVFGQGSSLLWCDNIAFLGSGASSGSIGLLTNDRISAGIFGDFTQQGTTSASIFGSNSCFLRWGRGAAVGHGCVLNARGMALTGNLGIGIWVLEGGVVSLRRAVVNGNGGTGIQINPGAVVKLTETRACGNGGDGMRLESGCEVYGEIPFFVANVGMGVRSIGSNPFHINEGVSILNGASGLYFSNGKGNASRLIIACNDRLGVEAVDHSTDIILDEAWITGQTGAAGSGHGILATKGSSINVEDAAIRGNKGDALNVQVCSVVIAPNCLLDANQGVSIRGDHETKIIASGSVVTDVVVSKGARVWVDGVSPTPTISGSVVAVNTPATNGTSVWNA